MGTAIVTGAAGLIGAAAVRHFAKLGFHIIGIDNDMRAYFFGPEASTKWCAEQLSREIQSYEHRHIDIRDRQSLDNLFREFGSDTQVIIHCAAQPSHDWAASEPFTDFEVNAQGTLNLLEMTRLHCSDAVFIFTSTNKVYGDTPNSLPLVELESRWEVHSDHQYFERGIDEQMSIDQCKHSIFGASKVAADVMVQEYGRYFEIKTGIFRCGCLTGPDHAGAQLHGFLAYLMKCAITKHHYTVFGYKGKQVRDNIHSADLVSCFEHFYRAPRIAAVYNLGGSRHSNCSVLEAITMCEDISGNKMRYSYSADNRIGDHIWWISDVAKFKEHYPDWEYKYNIKQTLEGIYEGLLSREGNE